jgi:hypothetical protein
MPPKWGSRTPSYPQPHPCPLAGHTCRPSSGPTPSTRPSPRGAASSSRTISSRGWWASRPTSPSSASSMYPSASISRASRMCTTTRPHPGPPPWAPALGPHPGPLPWAPALAPCLGPLPWPPALGPCLGRPPWAPPWAPTLGPTLGPHPWPHPGPLPWARWPLGLGWPRLASAWPC